MDSKLLEELTDDNIDEQLITEEIEKLSEEYDLRAIKSVYLCTVLVGCSHLALFTFQKTTISVSINYEKAALHQQLKKYRPSGFLKCTFTAGLHRILES